LKQLIVDIVGKKKHRIDAALLTHQVCESTFRLFVIDDEYERVYCFSHELADP
jgi:hypothetical protein